MRKPSLAQSVYNATFPHSRPSDPGTFAAHISRHLVPEVRVETSVFYGPPDCIESQYPGLDYSYGPHRLRLGRFPWHRRLFRVFDALKLTEDEISELCCWEGTKSARQRYEIEEGITVRDTTGQDVQPAAPTPAPTIQTHMGVDLYPPNDDQDLNMDARSEDTVRASESRSSSVASDYRQHEFEDEYSDEEVESCGVELNNRLRAAMAARDQGDNVPLDEDWEQWFKEAGERDGGYTEVMHAIRSNQPLNLFPEPPSANLRHNDQGVQSLTATTLAAEEWLLANPGPRFTSRPVLP
jgi:hypothetical protein